MTLSIRRSSAPNQFPHRGNEQLGRPFDNRGKTQGAFGNHPDEHATQPYQGMPDDISELFEAPVSKLETGSYVPPVPVKLRVESDAALTATSLATRKLGLLGLTRLLEDRLNDDKKTNPLLMDHVVANKDAVRDYAEGRYDPHQFYGQSAMAIRGVWSTGADEHLARQNGEERNYRLGATLAEYMFDLDRSAQEGVPGSPDVEAELQKILADYKAGIPDDPTDVIPAIEGTVKFRSVDHI